MKIYRPTIKTIEVSDISAKIACELYNRGLLNQEWLSDLYDEEEYGEDKDMRYVVEEAAIVIDKTLREEGSDILKDSVGEENKGA